MNTFYIKPSYNLIRKIGILLSVCYVITGNAHPAMSSPAEPSYEYTQREAEARSEIEQQRKEAEEKTQQTLIPEAVYAIEETKKAIIALNEGRDKDALAAVENATGKIDVLLARHPENALLPIDFTVEVVDLAPKEIKDIREISRSAHRAVDNKSYPQARILLDILRSELNIRTFNLPLAVYPKVLKNAAYLIEHKKSEEANRILSTAINTLVIIDQIVPIPVVTAKIFINAAEEKCESDKDLALKLLSKAKVELERAKELGYSGKDADYIAINNSINELEKHIKQGKGRSAFTTLKNKVKSFLKRQTEAKKQSFQPE